MNVDRMSRVNELLKREIAGIVFRRANQFGFDASAITVTRVLTSSNLRHARVLVSMREGFRDTARILPWLRRERVRIQAEMTKQVVLKYTPCLMFEQDMSIRNGDHVLDIISKLEADQELCDHGGEGGWEE